jgi:hypothetical protein
LANDEAVSEAIDEPVREDAPTAWAVHVVDAHEGTLTVADHRITFRRTGTGRDIDFPAASVRRIQLDIEQGRPATLVIVPDQAGVEAEVLTVDRSQFHAMSAAFLHLALDLDDVSH